MKKIIFVAILASIIALLFITTSCECCSSSNCNNQVVDSTCVHNQFPFIMLVKYENTTDIYCGESLDSVLEWTHYVNNDLKLTGNVFLDFSDWKEASVITTDEKNLMFVKETDTIYFNNLVYDKSILSFTAFGKTKRYVNFVINTDENYLKKFYDSLNQKNPAAFAVIFGLACLIAEAVDYYCDEKIARMVDICTSKGYCSKVNSCSASCIKCPSVK